MEFGVFDHLDKNDSPLSRYYRERLEVIEAYERAGFYAYHVAEHHLTDLGMAPSPSVFLAAVAQRTKRLRLGPMIYAAPLYHPLRLLQEICMLDQMSAGRLEMGFGRGARARRSPRRGGPIGAGTRASCFSRGSWAGSTSIRGRRSSTPSPRTGAPSPARRRRPPNMCRRRCATRAQTISSGSSPSAT